MTSWLEAQAIWEAAANVGKFSLLGDRSSIYVACSLCLLFIDYVDGGLGGRDMHKVLSEEWWKKNASVKMGEKGLHVPSSQPLLLHVSGLCWDIGMERAEES